MTAKVTFSPARTSKRLLAQFRDDSHGHDDYDRPRTRGDCLQGGVNAQRPCPWAGCRHHLMLDVGIGGGLTLVHGHDEVERLPVTCSLDVVDELGEVNLEAASQLLGVSRQRVHQIEVDAMKRAMRRIGMRLAFEELEDTRQTSAARRAGRGDRG